MIARQRAHLLHRVPPPDHFQILPKAVKASLHPLKIDLEAGVLGGKAGDEPARRLVTYGAVVSTGLTHPSVRRVHPSVRRVATPTQRFRALLRTRPSRRAGRMHLLPRPG